MGETSIAWTDFTFNPWIGCTKVSTGALGGCEGCYAEAYDNRWGGGHWGPGAPRRRTAPGNWAKPYRWDRDASATGKRKVFCASLADVFDNEVDPEWRADLFDVIRSTPNLRWILLTKRIGNAADMLPKGWPDGFGHVGLMATVVTQEEADRDVPKLLATPAAWRGLSIEPQMEAIYLDGIRFATGDPRHRLDALTGQALLYGCGRNGHPDMTVRVEKPVTAKLDWIITGGESAQPGHPARSYDLAWPRALIAQCRRAGAACFVKQLGARPVILTSAMAKAHDRAGADPSEWPEDLRVQDFPEALR